MNLCWATFKAVLGCLWPAGCQLDKHGPKVSLFWTFRRNVNCHTLNHFLRLQEFAREMGSKLCYILLIWWTHLMLLILPFLYPPVFISKDQNRVQPNKSRRYLFKAWASVLTTPLASFYISG